VRHSVEEIAAALRRLEATYPNLKEELVPSLTKCNELLELPEQEHHSFMNLSESDLNNAKHPMSEKIMNVFEPVLFPSQNYF
jgi:hypothetical protein